MDRHRSAGRRAQRLSPLARLSLTLRRDPRQYWATVAMMAVLVLGWMHGEQSRAADLRRQWGETRAVVRARVDLAGGSALTAGVVEIVDLPLAAVPRDAMDALPDGARVADRLGAGEIVTSVHVATPSSRGPVASQLHGAEVAIAVRADAAVPALVPGDPVLAIATAESIAGLEPFLASGRVVEVDDERVTIAVDANAAPTMALAVQSGRLTIAAAGSAGSPVSPGVGGLSATSSTTR